MPQVSVVIPAHNRAHLLERTLRSALGQTLADIEVIVVDDGSKDDLAPVVDGIKDDRVRFMRHAVNRGAGAARNTGLKEAKADFIAFLDSDDEWTPDKLERQVAKFAEAAPEVGVVTTWVQVQPGDLPVNEHERRGDLYSLMLTDNMVGTMSGPLIRKSALQAVDGFDDSLPSCQDWDLWVRLARVCRFELVPAPLTIHNRHDDTITRSSTASIKGHRLFAAKYADAVKALPRTLRAHHHLTLGEAFLWKRCFGDAAGHLLKAVWNDPRALIEIAAFVLRRIF